MRIYFAGTCGIEKRERMVIDKAGSRLISYYYMDKGLAVAYGFEYLKTKKNKHLFIDSGAFSAWTKGEEVDIYQYIDFIKKNRQFIDIYANLDVIGLNGAQPNKETAELTLKNQLIMEKAGLDPLPVFHIGEPYNYLEYYVKKYKYISLGIAGNLPVNLVEWMDECFERYICDKDGYPKIKVHGFAVTSLDLMLRYPWYSVDSTTWVTFGRNGIIVVPRRRSGQWVYDIAADKIPVSYKSPDIHKKGHHIFNMVGSKKDRVLEYIEQKGYKLGESKFEKIPANSKLLPNQRWAEKKSENPMRLVETVITPGLSNYYLLRDELNIEYFKDLEKNMPKWPWAFKRQNKVLF